MKNSNFDQLMERYLNGKVTEQEKVKIEAWLDVMKTEDTTNLELSREDEDKLFQKITSNIDNLNEVVAFKPGGERKITLTKWAIGIAATLLIVVVATYTLWDANDTENKLQVVNKNGVEKIILNDGTLVWLRGDSKLIYYDKPNEGIRYSELKGEALFEVAKDANHPFIINCNGLIIKVLGTSFNVKTGNNNLELKVLTGRVNLSTDANKFGIDVEPNEKVIYRSNGEIEKFSLDKDEITVITNDTNYNMQFTNSKVEKVIEGLGSKFNVKFKFSDNTIGNCHITADFTDHSLEGSLQMISEVLDVQFSKDGKSILVSGKGCE